MKHKYIFHLKIYHHIYGREGGTLGCLGAGERPGDSVEDTQGRGHQMRLVGPDANGRCQSVGQKIFQCCQPPATTTLPSISPPSTLPSPPFPAPARPDHSSTDHIISNSTSPSLSSAPPLSSPNMPLLGEIIVLLETRVRVEISLLVRAEEELSGDLPHPPPHHPELPRLADIKAQHCQLSGVCLSTDQERLPGLLLS